MALVLSLSGCSRGVSAQIPPAAGDPACARLSAALPRTLLKAATRATDPESPALHAWGNPAIILRCGVAVPGPTTEQCVAVNGIDWVVHELSDGVDFTTYGRTPAVQVLVPKRYVPETFALTGLSAAVGTIPQGPHRCS